MRIACTPHRQAAAACSAHHFLSCTCALYVTDLSRHSAVWGGGQTQVAEGSADRAEYTVVREGREKGGAGEPGARSGTGAAGLANTSGGRAQCAVHWCCFCWPAGGVGKQNTERNVWWEAGPFTHRRRPSRRLPSVRRGPATGSDAACPRNHDAQSVWGRGGDREKWRG